MSQQIYINSSSFLLILEYDKISFITCFNEGYKKEIQQMIIIKSKDYFPNTYFLVKTTTISYNSQREK